MANCLPRATILKFLTIVTCVITVNATLGKVLQDAVSMVGDSLTFSCSSNLSTEMHWYRDEVFLFARGKVERSFKERFTMNIDNVTGTYNLTLIGAKPEDAGLYKCTENLGMGEFSTAYLTVLESNPICQSNINADGFIGQNTCHLQTEAVQLSCAVSFSGKQPPTLTWSSSSGRGPINLPHCDVQPNRTVCSLTLRPEPSYDGSAFHCRVAGSSGARYNCSTEDVKVHYFIKDHDLKPVEKKINDEVSCSVNTNQVLQYNWTKLQDNDHVFQSNKQTYVIPSSGLYWCNVTYTIKGVACHTLVSVVHVQNEEAITGNQKAAIFAAVMSIALVALIAISIVGLICKRRRNVTKKNYRIEKEALETFLGQTGIQKFHPLDETPSNEKSWEFVSKLQLKDPKKPVYGIAILNDELFSISEKDPKFEVYSIKETFSPIKRVSKNVELVETKERFSHIRSCSVKGLTNPKDIISCSGKNCLFIKDYFKRDKKKENKEASASIFRVSPTGHIKKKWNIDGNTGQISIAGLCNVVVPLWDGSKLLEFTCNGKKVREIKISREANINFLRQAILVDYSYFVLIHGDDDSKEMQRVCALDLEGKLMKSFDEKAGNSKVNLPSHLVMNKDNTIIVADRINKRLLLLSSQLEFIAELRLDASEEHEFKALWRVCFYKENGLLFVADNFFKPVNGKPEGRIFAYSLTNESLLSQNS